MKFSIIKFVKEKKNPIMLIGSSLLTVGAVVWAFRAGANTKTKLDELPEDATTRERLAACAEMAGPILMAAGAEALKWVVYRNNIRSIIELTVAAAAIAKDRDIFEESVKEALTEEEYEAIKGSEAEKKVSEGDITPAHEVRESGSGNMIFVWEANNQAVRASKEWILGQIARAANDARKYNGDITLNDMADYFNMPGHIDGHDFLGYSASGREGLPDTAYFYNPSTDPTEDKRFGGERYVIFRLDRQSAILGTE